MLAVVSPAKKLDFGLIPIKIDKTEPFFKPHANELAAIAKKLSRDDLASMMKISEKLADLNWQRFQDFSKSPADDQTKQAVLAFAGDTYTGLDAASFDNDDLAFAQQHFRILSGLYGLLSPLDAIQPYRLEMGRKLKTGKGNTLYDYWGEKVARLIDDQMSQHKSKTVVNLASQEYFRVIDQNTLKARVLNIVFKEQRGSDLKIISFMAKKARGSMARFIIKNRITGTQALKDFNTGGYEYQPKMSDDDNWVFIR
jgi:cytoplasmic iron level regulating protein YaaA (DUF328/UPF0246 family)